MKMNVYTIAYAWTPASHYETMIIIHIKNTIVNIARARINIEGRIKLKQHLHVISVQCLYNIITISEMTLYYGTMTKQSQPSELKYYPYFPIIY